MGPYKSIFYLRNMIIVSGINFETSKLIDNFICAACLAFTRF